MALNGIQIFKLTPKKNCKECGCPTCMAFSMKVAQGAMKIEQCPHMSEDALASLSEATAPPMKTIKIGTGDGEFTLGGETVLFRHEKTFVSKTRYAVSLCTCMSDEEVEAKLAEIPHVDYDRIGERMHVELVYVNCDENADAAKFTALVEKAKGLGRTLILGCTDPEIAKGDLHLPAALASMFTMKYGSIIVMEQMTYAEALPLFGLRQNVFTDPQKPMKVEPGIYPLNGADENSLVVTTVDFALTYFVVSGELERSGVPLNLVINDAGGLSVLTSWAAGKFSGNSISEYIKENVEPKVKCRRLVIPGKVAVLKGDLEAKLPGWEIIVGPREAVQLVKFLKDLDA